MYESVDPLTLLQDTFLSSSNFLNKIPRLAPFTDLYFCINNNGGKVSQCAMDAGDSHNANIGYYANRAYLCHYALHRPDILASLVSAISLTVWLVVAWCDGSRGCDCPGFKGDRRSVRNRWMHAAACAVANGYTLDRD